MADAYIDFDETRIYGDYAIDQIAHHLVGRVREFDAALHLATATLRHATDSVAQQLHLARSADPSLHEAVSQQESSEVPEGTVLLQLRKGYRLRDRLLRPASVIVARKPEPTATVPVE